MEGVICAARVGDQSRFLRAARAPSSSGPAFSTASIAEGALPAAGSCPTGRSRLLPNETRGIDILWRRLSSPHNAPVPRARAWPHQVRRGLDLLLPSPLPPAPTLSNGGRHQVCHQPCPSVSGTRCSDIRNSLPRLRKAFVGRDGMIAYGWGRISQGAYSRPCLRPIGSRCMIGELGAPTILRLTEVAVRTASYADLVLLRRFRRLAVAVLVRTLNAMVASCRKRPRPFRTFRPDSGRSRAEMGRPIPAFRSSP